MNYNHRLAHVNDRTGMIFMASLFTVLAISVVSLRFHARWLTKAGLGADDWLASIGLIFVLALNGIFIAGAVQGAITGHSPVVDNWPVTTPLEHLVQKYKYGFQTTEKLFFGLIKLSLLCLWKRMFGRAHMHGFIRMCHVMMVLVAAWSTAFFLATVFQCGARQWELNWAPIGVFLTQCSNTLNMLTVFTATDVMTDFIIMFMPVPIIWKLQMPVRKKVGVTSIFMVGLFTIGAGIARMYIYLVTSYDKDSNPDFIADFTLFILWSEIEANVAMIVCCMPTLAPVIGKFHDGFTHYVHSLQQRSKWSLPSTLAVKLPGSPGSSGLESQDSGSAPMSVLPAATWQTTVATAAHVDMEEQRLRCYYPEEGIVTRTEFSTVSEPKFT